MQIACPSKLQDSPSSSRPKSLALGTLYAVPADSLWPRPALSWQLPDRYSCHSWALIGGPHRETDRLVWLSVRNEDLPPGLCPQALAQKALDCRSWSDSLAFMTSASLDLVQTACSSDNELLVSSVVTVGLGNALRAGDPAAWSPRIGTINIATALNLSLDPRAAIESLSVIAEAKAAALSDARIYSRISGRIATGTGTDCHAIASPREWEGALYAGKHTRIGSLVGKTVYEAVRAGCELWKTHYPDHQVLLGIEQRS